MKKIVLILLFILVAVLSYAQEVVYTNQATVAWDAVAPIKPADIITYQVWIDSAATGLLMVGETDLLQYTITFTVEGGYIIGVGAKREIFGEVVYSDDINWSDVNIPVGSTPVPFVIVYIMPIQSPGNLRMGGQNALNS
ncbi:hypothetical protein LCGC14_1628210 [marine sediment metagenome]|uniref:Uncharacterized protein n=1 Tax=marine sediment metagenome TaxID=412755 RepID=A0A0F9I3R7_9ZZZZ